jgi:translation initiation factor 1 (eIF-1/SUI1)
MAEKKKPIILEWQGGIKESLPAGVKKVEIRDGSSKVNSKNAQKNSTAQNLPFPKNGFKAKIRKELKGRSGHPVLVIHGFTPHPPSGEHLNSICSKLKSSLGVGGTVEDGTIVVQTLNEDRVKTLLEKFLLEPQV